MLRTLGVSARSRALCGMAIAALALLTIPALGSEKVIYAFHGGSDGSEPLSPLIADGNGNLYGTTGSGGGSLDCQGGCGTVFKLAPNGRETVLHAFAKSDGAMPWSNLVLDQAVNLYGTTNEGGFGAGVVFKLAPDGSETVLYEFQAAPDGAYPSGNIVTDGTGNLYGTTVSGGNTGGSECQALGCGTVFKLAPDGTETVLHAFQGGSDGYSPKGGVVLDSQGNLYGTTESGGSATNCSLSLGCGTVFKVAPDGTETVLYAFQGGNDGVLPWGSLLLDQAGNLYGTTLAGGACDCGTVFKLGPDGTKAILYVFQGGSDGIDPYAGLEMDKAGNLYGTTYLGGGTGCKEFGHLGCGTVFQLTPKGKETVLVSFKGKFGTYPTAPLLLKNGNLYGTASGGGRHSDGVVFSLERSSAR